MTSFVTETDLVELKKHDIHAEDIPIFTSELITYFNTIWPEEYKIENVTTLDELNKSHLLEYPSSGGHYILDDAFTGSCPLQILSNKSKLLLGYFYNIHLR